MQPVDTFCLRLVASGDLPAFFQHQQDVESNHMAAFTAKEPSDRSAFLAHWERIQADATVIARAIILDGQAVGHVMSYQEAGTSEVTYWLGKEHWGRGVATRALTAFLADVNSTRPIYSRAAKDNYGSLRVLEKLNVTL